MFRKTIDYKQECGGLVTYRVTTYYFLFIPVYKIKEELV
jgi:hypothetical protein